MTKRFLLTVLLDKRCQRAYFLNVQGGKLDFDRIFLQYFPSKIFSTIFFNFSWDLQKRHAQEKLKKNAYTKFWRDNKEYYIILGKQDRFWGGPTGPRKPLFVWNVYYFNTILRKIKSIYVAGWKVSRPPLSEFSGSAPVKRLSSFSRSRLWPECRDKNMKFSSLCQSFKECSMVSVEYIFVTKVHHEMESF